MASRQADLHFHALAGVDDGPATMQDALDLLESAEADGTTQVVATPHIRPDCLTDPAEIPDRVRELQAAAEAAGLAVAVRAGGELDHRMVGVLGQSDLEVIAHGPPGARWLLLETPFAAVDEDFHQATAELRDRGFAPLLAHPERSAGARADGFAALRRELAAGARAQVNAGSLAGDHGDDARASAFELVRLGLVAVVGSDAHGPARPPRMAAARLGLSPDVGRALTIGGPLTLLARGMPFTERSREGRDLDIKMPPLQGNLAS